MSARCWGLALAFVTAGSLVVVPASFADSATASSPAVTIPTTVAKAPAPVPAKAPPEPAVAPAKAGSAAPKLLKVAQLEYPVPPTASAAELLQAVEDYAFCRDWVSYRQYLRQVITSYGGTKEAGQALVMLLNRALMSGDEAQAQALSTELEAYPDPEIQAFASMTRTAAPAAKAEQLDAVEQAYANYADQWRGTPSGWWARLQLGHRYRFQRGDFARAITVFQELLAEEPAPAVAEEAQFALAQCLHWFGRAREARQALDQVIASTRSPGLQMRALVSYSEVLGQMGADRLALEAASAVIDSYPTHPCAGFAYAQRSIVFERQGQWEPAVADVRAYFAYPPAGTYNQARGHYILGCDAYRHGRLEEAAAEFTAVAGLVEADQGRTLTSGFGARAQAGLAAVNQDRGELRSAIALLQNAADLSAGARQKAEYLYQAATLAAQVRDEAVRQAVIARMAAEAPDHHLTARLAGRELRPAPAL